MISNVFLVKKDVMNVMKTLVLFVIMVSTCLEMTVFLRSKTVQFLPLSNQQALSLFMIKITIQLIMHVKNVKDSTMRMTAFVKMLVKLKIATIVSQNLNVLYVMMDLFLTEDLEIVLNEN